MTPRRDCHDNTVSRGAASIVDELHAWDDSCGPLGQSDTPTPGKY